MDKLKPLKFFKVGKKIKRDALPCPCESCSKPSEFIIADEDHAKYLHMNAIDLNINYEEA